jgi:hypothetical protein
MPPGRHVADTARAPSTKLKLLSSVTLVASPTPGRPALTLLAVASLAVDGRSGRRRYARTGSKRSLARFRSSGTRVGYSRVKQARQTESSSSSVAHCMPSAER